MKNVKKLFWLLLMLSLVTCGRGGSSEDPWPYVLIEAETDNGAGDTFKLPIRFNPATGEYAAVCGETEHGETCPFWSECYYDANFTVWRDILFWAKRHDGGYTVCTYNMTTGETQSAAECSSPGSFRIVGDYLYLGNSLKIMERICLTDGTAAEDPAGKRPDWVEGSTAYYRIEGVRGKDGGVFRQELYEKNSIRIPFKELLFADAAIRSCRYDADALFWEGNSSYLEEENHLYRYDLRTRTNMVLKANFDGSICVGTGDWLYSVQDNSLQQIHKKTGEQRLVYASDSMKLSINRSSIQEAGGYIVVLAFEEEQQGRLVYHPISGETEFYPGPAS